MDRQKLSLQHDAPATLFTEGLVRVSSCPMSRPDCVHQCARCGKESLTASDGATGLIGHRGRDASRETSGRGRNRLDLEVDEAE
ncbi:hypothetical protein AVEN_109671-1 [Araneus ventricosus]|uniref:Uncharacterized protein n=1 Tax=Araneus ventricosus TaxID=182803 RepID=A0A4Y2FY84_ARAVE|nr:hypothetical protein AVEN_109671-1 [Araneus ventricosus]